MSRFLAVGGLLAIVLSTVASGRPSVRASPPKAEARTTAQQEDAAVRATFSEIISAFNAHDAKRWAGVMDTSFMNWAGNVRGADEEGRFIAAYFSRQRGTRYRQLEEIGLSFLTPEVALYRTYGEVSNTVDTNGQVQPPSEILEAWLFRKRGDKWGVAAYFTRPSSR